MPARFPHDQNSSTNIQRSSCEAYLLAVMDAPETLSPDSSALPSHSTSRMLDVWAIPSLPSSPDPAHEPELGTGSRIVIGVDYGTNYSGVAWLLVKDTHDENSHGLANDIRLIENWKFQLAAKVPSLFTYSGSPNGCEQWGYEIDPNSRVLRWTKLALEETNEREKELQNLSALLLEMANLDRSEVALVDNDLPIHLAKEPADIVTDYLRRVADNTYEELSGIIGEKTLAAIPIDIVIAHPAPWSDLALNSMSRAIRASFNTDLFPTIRDVFFVNEPEACAHFTLREPWRQRRGPFKKNDCFIVIDAGGGTVDIAAYRVTTADPVGQQLKIEQIGAPLGDTCGAALIDTSFEELLKDRLGAEDYGKLNSITSPGHTTGGHNIVQPGLQMMLQRFQPVMHQFDGSVREPSVKWPIQLPRGIGEMDDEEKGILNGALMLTADDLRTMFAQSVEKTLVLLSQMVTQIKFSTKHSRLKRIFLTGGFGRNQYLFERINEFGRNKGIAVEGNSDGWGAVAQGAIIKTLGLYSDKPTPVKICPRHYGIKVRSQFSPHKHKESDKEVDVEGLAWATEQVRWFVKQGDTIFPDNPIVAQFQCHWTVKASDFPDRQRKKDRAAKPSQTVQVLRNVVFVATAKEEAPARFDGLNEPEDVVLTLQCDLAKAPAGAISEFVNRATGKYVKIWTEVAISVSDRVYIKVTSGGKTLCMKEVPL